MPSSTGINFVRYFFYDGNGMRDSMKKELAALGYAAARELGIAPKEILIRSGLHNTTSQQGKHVIDPKGWHGTFAFKFEDHAQANMHVAAHGYTPGKGKYTLVDITFGNAKPDNTPRSNNGVVWPASADLEEFQYVGHSHLP